MAFLKLSSKLVFVMTFFILSANLSACSDNIYILEGVEGPLSPTPLMDPVFSGPEQFNSGETSRLAILITEETSNWLALATGLKTIGVPFRMTTEVDEALHHDMVMVYPQITGLNLSPTELKDLREYVLKGGTLIGSNILGGGMADVFGFETISENKLRYRLTFQEGFNETAEFIGKGLSEIKIGNQWDSSLNPGTNSYIGLKNRPLAIYENGEAAVITNNFGDGKTYGFGMDLGQLLGKGYNRRQTGISNHYANEYQPVLDAWLMFIENIYKNQNHPTAVLGTVPDGKSLSFMLSHDIDFSKSLENALPYAAYQNSESISGTYFIQTKYVRDYNDKIFFTEHSESTLRKLEDLGAEIGSHSVAHSNAMWNFEIGDGAEYYPDYRPFVRTAKHTKGATLMGELRVSKFLLDNFLTKEKVHSFRPGFLSNPSELPQVLASTGYKYSSSATANISLTHLPFQLSYGREFSAFSSIFEIPITVEDELDAPMIDRLEQSKTLARQIAKIGGTYVVLIHTDDVDSRLDFQKEIVNEVKSYAWMGSISQFGDWWSARDKVSVDMTNPSEGMYVLKLHSPTPIDGLTIELNEPLKIINSSIPMEDMQALDKIILLHHLSGEQKITFQR